MTDTATETIDTGGAGPELWAALAVAQSNAGAVEKDARNKHGGYNYASAEAVITAAREALAPSLAFVLIGWSIEGEIREHDTTDRKGNAVTYQQAMVRARWLLAHASGQRVEVSAVMPAIEQAGRPLDKAVSTALTYLQSYVLRGLLNMPRVEQGMEPDQRDDSGHNGHRGRGRGYTPQPGPSQRREAPAARDERKAAEQAAAERYGELRAASADLWRRLFAATGDDPSTWRDVAAQIMGQPWPDRPSLSMYEQLIHSLGVSVQEAERAVATGDRPAPYEDPGPPDNWVPESESNGKAQGDLPL